MRYYYSRFVRWLARRHIEPMAVEIVALRNALHATRMQLYNLERRGGGRRRTDAQGQD
jgi:hypothetical protein